MGTIKDITGQRFGRLVAIEPIDEKYSNKIVWKCQCDCGNIAYVIGNNLRRKNTLSCGCLHKEITKQVNKKMKNKDNAVPKYILMETLKKNNTSGILGVHYAKKDKQWCAQIQYAKHAYYLLESHNINDCIAIRKEAEDHVRQGDFLEWIADYKASKWR